MSTHSVDNRDKLETSGAEPVSSYMDRSLQQDNCSLGDTNQPKHVTTAQLSLNSCLEILKMRCSKQLIPFQMI